MAVVVDYPGLRAAVASRRRQLGMTQLELDAMSGVPAGYTGKLEVGLRNFGDMSLSCVLQTLGLVLVPAPIEMLHPEKHNFGLSTTTDGYAVFRQIPDLSKARAVRNTKLSPYRRASIAKKAAAARWDKARAAKKERVNRTGG